LQISVDSFPNFADFLNRVTRYMKKSNQKLTQAAAAVLLGVSREHLNYVLRGRRTSRRLSRDYKILLAEFAQNPRAVLRRAAAAASWARCSNPNCPLNAK